MYKESIIKIVLSTRVKYLKFLLMFSKMNKKIITANNSDKIFIGVKYSNITENKDDNINTRKLN